MPIFRSSPRLFICCIIALTVVWYIGMYSFTPYHYEGDVLMRSDYGSLLASCHDSSNIDFHRISNLHQSEKPAAYLISPGKNVFSKGTLCLGVVVYIPESFGKNASHGLNIDNYPPDAIYLDIVGNDFQVVPKTEPKFVQVEVEKGLVRYYQLNINFRDGDDYLISGYLEYINYLWNFETAQDVFWNPFPLRILKFTDSKYELINSLNISIKGLNINPESYEMLPLCKNGNLHGRWVKSSMIERKSHPTVGDSDWSTRRDAYTFYQNPEGKIWVPYDCRYRPFSYSELASCLSNTTTHLHVYGDSNIRRALKAITTGGAWCNTFYDQDSSDCECSDQGRATIPNFKDENDVNYFAKVAGSNRFSILYEKVTGFYSHQGPFDQILNISHIIKSFSDVGQKKYQRPSAVIFNLVNWDAGFFKWEDYKVNVLKIVESMKTTYKGVPLIFRPGQYYSGHVDTSVGSGLPRRYSRLRIEAFNHYAINIFFEQLQDQILIWDIAALGEAFSPQLKNRVSLCVSNHMFRSGVDLENQLLFNMLCPNSN